MFMQSNGIKDKFTRCRCAIQSRERWLKELYMLWTYNSQFLKVFKVHKIVILSIRIVGIMNVFLYNFSIYLHSLVVYDVRIDAVFFNLNQNQSKIGRFFFYLIWIGDIEWLFKKDQAFCHVEEVLYWYIFDENIL